MILLIQKTKQIGTHPKTTKQPINHTTLGQFYAVNVCECDLVWTGMHAWIIVAVSEISLLLKKEKTVDVLAEDCPNSLVILQCAPPSRQAEVKFADRA